LVGRHVVVERAAHQYHPAAGCNDYLVNVSQKRKEEYFYGMRGRGAEGSDKS